MDNCIFCKIARREIPAEIVYEDDSFIGFLDIHPVNAGHVLVIPKEHYKNMAEAPENVIGGIFVVCKEMMNRVKKAMGADYVALSVVGVDVPHLHVHIIPRYFNDGMAGFWPTREYKEGEMKLTGDKIRNAVKEK